MNNGKIVVGVLAGVAVGALLGVLFAPDKGTETRKKIARKGSDAADDIKNEFEELLGSMREKLDAAKREAASFYEKGKQKADDLKRDFKS